MKENNFDNNPCIFEFYYPKEDLKDTGDGFYFPIDYDRFRELLKAHPKQAFELALMANAVDLNTGKIKKEFIQDNMVDYLEWQLLEVVNMVSSFGLSGSIAPYFFDCLIPLLKQENIKPLTGADWEWMDVSRFSDDELGTIFQNRRFSSIFKKGIDGEAYWVHGKAFSTDGENYYTRSNGSSIPISFPCVTRELETEFVLVESDNEKGEE